MMRKKLETGFCPFRIETSGFLAGCILQIGKETPCYSQDAKPLRNQGDCFFCPLLKFNLSKATYDEFGKLVSPLLAIQDEASTGINLWPMISGMADPTHQAITGKGIELQRLSAHVKEELEEIVFNLV